MKRKIILILVLVFVLSVFVACTTATVTLKKQVQNNESMFVVIETTTLWKIVYHKETRVMYAVSYSSYNGGNFTLLVDADGNPLLWEGGSEQ